MNTLLKLLLVVFLFAATTLVQANQDHLLMIRTAEPFEIAMEKIQRLIEEYGYSVAHIQRCDGGLNDFDYETDYYRVIFFGKYQEVKVLSSDYPEIIPFLPLKFLVFAENDESIIVSLNPETLAGYFDSPEIKNQLKRWHNDINEMFSEMRL